MQSFSLFALSLLGPVANAAAISHFNSTAPPALNETAPFNETLPRPGFPGLAKKSDTLPVGHYILDNGDKTEIVDEDQLKAFLKAEGIALAPSVDESWLDFTPPEDLPSTNASALSARQASCDRTTSYVTDKTERFVNWDVQMSPVVLGTAEGITVAVASGYSVANSISASAGIDVTLIKDYLSGSVGVDYTTTWTTTTSNTYTTTIKNGDAGVWITRPWTNRRSGRTMRGCPGSLTQTGTWMADSYENGSYDNAKWVSGFITTCVKTAPSNGQLTRCNGGGVFV
ncbi:hypothetical protein KJ359_012319 [Pestalotiopsis sp. 9143b]|nr:hypothetical protein KJ359_012319 [Pestalotiopsis sp. 9143b]